MSKSRIAIRFKNIYRLWNFAGKIKATHMEIFTSDLILICDCTEEQLALLAEYDAMIVEEYDFQVK